MSTQKEIARALNITQATVSMALRGDRRISAEVRQAVQDAAVRMNYRPNAYVNALMTHIRSGRKPSDKGAVGLLIEAPSQQEWYEIPIYRTFHQGVLQRSLDLGFHVESFFLQQPEMTASRIDRILQARGITGIILAPPYHGNRTLNMVWPRYAAIGVGFGWEQQDLNRVVYDQFQNFVLAFKKLRQMGYRRIGTVLSKKLAQGHQHGVRWHAGYLAAQYNIPETDRIPALTNDNPPPGAKISEIENYALEGQFKQWFLKWKPDALLTIVGREKKWIKSMGLKIPNDIGIACLSLPQDSDFAGVDEKSDVVGAVALELIAAQIGRNEFGIPSHPRAMMIEGRWVPGATLRE